MPSGTTSIASVMQRPRRCLPVARFGMRPPRQSAGGLLRARTTPQWRGWRSRYLAAPAAATRRAAARRGWSWCASASSASRWRTCGRRSAGSTRPPSPRPPGLATSSLCSRTSSATRIPPTRVPRCRFRQSCRKSSAGRSHGRASASRGARRTPTARLSSASTTGGFSCSMSSGLWAWTLKRSSGWASLTTSSSRGTRPWPRSSCTGASRPRTKWRCSTRVRAWTRCSGRGARSSMSRSFSLLRSSWCRILRRSSRRSSGRHPLQHATSCSDPERPELRRLVAIPGTHICGGSPTYMGLRLRYGDLLASRAPLPSWRRRPTLLVSVGRILQPMAPGLSPDSPHSMLSSV
mmetsp:Transcript_55139/g.131297  ORF Transcript_55139/g.131297 Transcript_55139/m.131297 type:complete len:349 (-) Transcript_55139:295-1341(-)